MGKINTFEIMGDLQNDTGHKKRKTNVLGLSQKALAQSFQKMGISEKDVNMRVKQVWSWIYSHGKISFDDMTNLSKDFRFFLNENFNLERPIIVKKQVSLDGTRKYLFKTDRIGEFETVFIPEEDRGTVCLSSQIRCTLNCSFSHT